MGRDRVLTPLTEFLSVWALVSTSEWAFLVAVSVYAFNASGAEGVAAVTAARFLPAAFVAPFTGHWIDRVTRRTVVTLACLIQGACLLAASLLMIEGAGLAAIVVLAVALSVAATAPRPALQSLMPALARTPAELTRATGIWGAVDNGAFLVGGGAGGIAIAAAGPGAVASATAVMMTLAAALAARLPPVRATALDGSDGEGFTGVLAGFRAVLRSPMLRWPYALFAGALLLEGTSNVQLVSLALGPLGMGNGGPGVLWATWGVGGLLGSALLVALVRRRGYGLALVGGGLAFAAGLAISGVDGVAVALIAMIPAGAGFVLVETAPLGLVPRLADDAVTGRVYALSEILYAAGGGLGALIAPPLIDAFGVAGSLAAVGIAYGGLVLAGWFACARLDAGQERATCVRELLHGIDFLAPLPLPRLERLVRTAEPRSAPAGAEIVRRGEPGEKFFVIERGIVEIVEIGSTQGPGEGFGEIALLRDVPRTATVRARGEVQLWTLSRSAFIAAVTGETESTRLADALVAERLARSRAQRAQHRDAGHNNDGARYLHPGEALGEQEVAGDRRDPAEL